MIRRLGKTLLAVIATIQAVPALAYLFDPLRRERRAKAAHAASAAGQADPLPVASLAEVPDIATAPPLSASVIARDLRDAWNRLPEVRLGLVWLYRRGSEVVCLSAVCPHAGCIIGYDERQKGFVCPCHNSSFAIDGTRHNGPSPRDMDRLDVEVKGGEVLCRYQRFRTARSTKEPI